MKALTAGENALRKIFSSDHEFMIPDYQRPYVWGQGAGFSKLTSGPRL